MCLWEMLIGKNLQNSGLCPQSRQSCDCSLWGSAWRRFALNSPAARSSDSAVTWALMWASCTQMGYYEFRCCHHLISVLAMSLEEKKIKKKGKNEKKGFKALRNCCFLYFFIPPLGYLACVYMNSWSFQLLGFGSSSALLVSCTFSPFLLILLKSLLWH